MKELKIYKYQAETIKDALRLVSNHLKSHTNETAMDRTITQALGMINTVLEENPDKLIIRKFT